MLAIRAARADEFEAVRGFYHRLIDMMEGSEFHPRWEKGVYPSDAFMRSSIERSELYVGMLGEEIAAAMVINGEGADGYDGAPWSVSASRGEFSVIHTPGHTPGSVCFAFEDCLFTGDTLFKNAIGRTDFSDGSPDDMRASLAKLYRMPGDFVVYPGHDERSLLSDERDRNPFFADVRGRVWEK